jgi:uncharacterized delta-60 repeat protein
MVRRPSPLTRRPACEPLESRWLFDAGDPDPAFNSGVPATINFPGASFQVNDVAVQSTGKIIAVGAKSGSLAITRLNVNGTIDTTFGTGGLFESAAAPEARGVAIAADDKIVLALGFDPGGFDYQAMRVGRLHANGSNFDSTFSGDGIATIAYVNPTYANAVTIQTDGKIIVAGTWKSGDNDFLIVRYNTNGSPDNSFDTDGIVEIGFGQEEEASALAIDYNGTPETNPYYGTIVVVGDKRPSRDDPSTNFTIARLNSNGTPDTRFDTDGKMTSPDLSPQPGESATGVHIQPNGKVVVTGTALAIGGGAQSGDFLLARYLFDGGLDPSFGPTGTGIVQNDFGADERALDAAPNFLGGILVSGGRSGSAVLAAYTPNGLPETRFSGDGFMTASGGPAHVATTLASINPVRRIVLGGGNRVGRYIDLGGSTVGVGVFNAELSEGSQTARQIIVARNEILPTSLRVYINFAGTARSPIFSLPSEYDYTIAGVTLMGFNNFRNYIDIPANQSLTTFSITPFNDTRSEPDETIEVSVDADETYEIGTPPSTTLVIRDNDAVGGPAVTSSAFVYDSGAPQRSRFTFSQNVATSIGANDFTVTGPTGAVPFSLGYDEITNTATLSFSGVLPDGNYTATALAAGITNSGGTPMSANHALPFFFFAGDADHDRDVDVNDLGILATNWQQSPRTFSQGDFDYSGTVDVNDLGILATHWQQVLAAPSAATTPNAPSRRPGRVIDGILT